MKVCVLLVDDDGPLSVSILRSLRSRWTLTICSSGAEALELLEGPAEYDAILLDLFLPDLNGAAIWDRLGETAPARKERVILFTAGGRLVPDWIEETGRPVVHKPVDANTLAAVVERVARQKGPRGPTYDREPVAHDTPHLRAVRELVDQRIDEELAELRRRPRRSGSLPDLAEADPWEIRESQTGSHIIVHASEPLKSAIEETVVRMKREEELRAAAGRWAAISRWWKLWWEKFGTALIMLMVGTLARELLLLLSWLWKIAKH